MKNLEIYKASAGSGKTYLLTATYLKLAFAETERFKHILAVTFTNKAAEEMKVRILGALAQLAGKDNKGNAVQTTNAEHFSTITSAYPQLSAHEIQQRAADIHTAILHNYSLFSVSTIDSFVQRIIRSFAFEIGLRGAYRVEMDLDKAKQDITKLLYAQLPENKKLLNWLYRFSEYRMEMGKSWDFRNDIENLASEIFKEQFQRFYGSISENRAGLDSFYEEVRTVKDEIENKLGAISVKAKKITDTHAASMELTATLKQVAAFLTNKIAKPIVKKEMLPGKTVAKAIGIPENWHPKSAKPAVKDAALSVYTDLNPLLEEATTYIEANYSRYLTAINVLQNFHAFGVLGDLGEILPKYRDEENLLLISDSTLLLKEIINANDTPFIYERTGERYQHILIDEFQDTSGFQWENFKPLVQNALANANSNLIVGDIKQSIYRWRGGDWKLLLKKVQLDIGAEYVNAQSLDTNYRSRKNIVDFNNAAFAGAAQLLQNNFTAKLNEVNHNTGAKYLLAAGYDHLLTDAYADTYQENSGKPGGKVSVQIFDIENARESKDEYNEIISTELPYKINSLLNSYEPKSLAVLVRKNSEAVQVVEMLNRYMHNEPGAQKYDIISGDALFLKSSPAVQILLSALHLVQKPTDSFHTANLVYSYSKLYGKPSEELHQIFSANKPEQAAKLLPKTFISELDTLKHLPLVEIIDKLISAFGLNNIPEFVPYLSGFQDFVLNFAQISDPGLEAFLESWYQSGVGKTVAVSDKQNALTVITVHKSKGLAFDVVLLPFTNWPLTNKSAFNAPIIWASATQEPFSKLPFLPIKYKAELAETDFAIDYFEEELYQYMDALNMLYVAFTRPKQELHIFVKNEKAKELKHVGHLLVAAMEQSTAKETPHTIGLAKFIETKPHELILDENHELQTEPQSSEPNSGYNTTDYPVHDWRKRLAIVPQAANFFKESVAAIGEKVNYGVLMHHIFAEISRPNEAEGVLREMVFSGIITETEKQKLLADTIQILAKPHVAEWYSVKYDSIAEQGILTEQGETRIPDRILTNGKQATVIDFKFGKPEKSHHAQVTEYMELVTKLGYTEVKGILYYAETDTVVNL